VGGFFWARAAAAGTVTFDYTIAGTNVGSFGWFNSGNAFPTGPDVSVSNLVTTPTGVSISVQAGDIFGFHIRAGTGQFDTEISQRTVTIQNFRAPVPGPSLGSAPPGPTPVVPEGGGPPGPFPNTSVSAVNVIARGSATAFNGNVEIVGYEGQGPIPWTVTKYNRGDIAMRLAPANPAAADANTLNRGFIDFTTPTDASVAEAQSWRPHPARGVTIPTARQNGPIDWGDGEGGFFPTVAVSGSSSGPGYDMLTGAFGTGGLDINLGRAGTHASSPEGNFGFSVAWFPYDAGWIGGKMGNPDAGTGVSSWNGANQHSAGLVPALMKWEQFPPGSGTYGGLGMLRLPGVNAVSNGMVFATSANGNSDVNIVGLAPTNDATGGSGWIVTIREDSALGGEEVATAGQYQFEFVYVPYTAQNLIGGYIEGATGTTLQSAGAFTILRTELGTYELTIPGKRGTNGTLLLQVADLEPGTAVPMASRAFMSYEYDSATGKFIIQARNMFVDTESDLVDTSFYFAWVDFAQPLAPPSGPRLRSIDQVVVADINTINVKEANVAVNTDMPEILITTIDQSNTGAYVDPTTGLPAVQALVGYFYDPRTLTKIRGPFFIMGNGAAGTGNITRHDVKYNPVSDEYIVVGCARQYENSAIDLVMISRVGNSTSAGEPLLEVSVFDGLQNGLSYDDVSVAVSPVNGNFILVAEHRAPGEGTAEATFGALFDRNGAPLTPTPGRLDRLQPTGDEDDPDVIYLPSRDVFMYLSNTDFSGGLANKIVGSIIQTVPDAMGNLQVSGPEQSLAATTGVSQGHPASIENPFNGEVITAFDTGGNNTPTGELSYFDIGPGPAYTFTEARPQQPYLAGAGGDPFQHQHPQLGVDPNSGVFVLGYNARGSTVGLPDGYVFSVLDMNGSMMPSQLGAPYYLMDGPAIETTVNFHNIKYDPSSDSFVAVAAAGASGARVLYLAAVQVTSSALPEAPRLTITRSGSDVVIRWPASATGYVLEASASLSAPSWSAVSGTPQADGDFLRMTVPIGSGMRFFRLIRN
jgi:hypothetical protein